MDISTNVLSLCSGGGGLDLGLRLAIPSARTICYVENEVTACGLLAARMEDKSLDAAPIWTDLRSFDGKPWRGVVDWVIGGYPCQPFSNAGRRLGTADPRHLWPDVQRIVADVAPRFCFFENVGAHLRLGAREVIGSLQDMGYRTAATLLTASEVGAPHGRERLFILAYSPRQPQREQDDTGRTQPRRNARENTSWIGLGMADTDQCSGSTEPRQQHQERTEVAHRPSAWPPGPNDTDAWRRVLELRPDLAPAVEPHVRGVADGVARGLGRSDQLHILGNGVVPQQAAYVLRLLMEAMAE